MEESPGVAVVTRPVDVTWQPDASTPSRSRRALSVAPAMLVLAAVATRFYAINSQSLWYDEGVSAGMVGLSPLTIIRDAAADFHPPLYYLLLAAWARIFGASATSLRGLSACAGVVLVVVTWRLATRLYGRRTGWWAAIWACVAPLGITYSQELRMYMPVAACVALAAYCAVRTLDSEGKPSTNAAGAEELAWSSKRYLAAYTVLAATALYLQYVAALGLTAVGLYGLLRARGRVWRQWVLANGIAIVLFAPWLPVFHHQLAVGRTATTAQTSAGAVLSAAAGSLLVGVDGVPYWNEAAIIALAALVTLGVWRSVGNGLRSSFPLFLVAMPLAGVTAYAAWKAVYEVRYVLVALPGLAMLGGLGIVQFAEMSVMVTRRAIPPDRGMALCGLAAGAVVLATSGLADIRYYQAPLHPHDDYRSLTAVIAGQAKPGDAVLLYPPGQSNVFAFYYHGPDPIVSLPLQRPPDTADVTARLTGLFGEHSRVWVVEYGAIEADPGGLITTWLSQHAFLASHQWFGSPQLLLYLADNGGTAMTPAGERFTNGAVLQSYAVTPRLSFPGGTVDLTLNWYAGRPIPQRFTVFTHLLDANNNLIAQHDGEPADGTRPTSNWQPGDVVADRHGLVLPAHLAPGDYTIEVGMYLSNGGARAQVLGVGEQIVSNRVLLGHISVRRSAAS